MGYSLILSGGGARGFFHMGLLKAIQELNIEIDEIAGTSIGAVIGAIYATDPKIDFDKLVDSVDYRKLVHFQYKGAGFFSTSKVEKYLKKFITVEKFSDLKIKLKFPTVDINTGEEVDFERGKLFPALTAAVSIPAVFPVVKVKNRYLCDGGLLNEIPFNLVNKKKHAIVSDITLQKKKITERSNKLNVFENMYIIPRMKLIEKDIEKYKKRKDVIYIEFHKSHHMFDFRKKHLRDMINIGYKEGKKLLKGKR